MFKHFIALIAACSIYKISILAKEFSHHPSFHKNRQDAVIVDQEVNLRSKRKCKGNNRLNPSPNFFYTFLNKVQINDLSTDKHQQFIHNQANLLNFNYSIIRSGIFTFRYCVMQILCYQYLHRIILKPCARQMHRTIRMRNFEVLLYALPRNHDSSYVVS